MWESSSVAKMDRSMGNVGTHYKQSPTYDNSTYDFLTLQRYKSNMHAIETVLRILNYLFLGMILSRDARQWQQATRSIIGLAVSLGEMISIFF